MNIARIKSEVTRDLDRAEHRLNVITEVEQLADELLSWGVAVGLRYDACPEGGHLTLRISLSGELDQDEAVSAEPEVAEDYLDDVEADLEFAEAASGDQTDEDCALDVEEAEPSKADDRSEAQGSERVLLDADAPGFNPRRQTGIRPDGVIVGRYADDETALLIEMRAKGETAGDIAEALGREVDPVTAKIQKLKPEIEAFKSAAGAQEGGAAENRSPAPAAQTIDPPEGHALTQVERAINQRLNDLGYAGPWTAELDLKLASIIERGAGVAGAGAVLRIEAAVARQRWAALHPGGDEEGLKALLIVLRWRVSQQQALAAE